MSTVTAHQFNVIAAEIETPTAGEMAIGVSEAGALVVVDSAGVEHALGGDFVESVSGTTVDNTDPTNPVVNAVRTVVLKEPVKACTASDGNIALTGEQTIDSVSCVAGDRVLVSAQSTGSQNGVYVVASGAWTRATDFDAAAELIAGTMIPVSLGAVYTGAAFMLSNSGAITIGSTALTFAQVGVLPAYMFSFDNDTGIVRGAANRLDIYAGGSAIALYSSTGVLLNSASYSFRVSGNVGGVFRVGNNVELRPHTGGDISIGTNAALATNATSGFLDIPSCAGTPTGTPGSVDTGKVPIVVDTTNNKLYGYYGGAWHDLTG